MAVFYSFHYDRDAWRIQQIVNMGALEGQPILNAQDWESIKRGGDQAIKNWIADQMKYKTAVVVLVGAQTDTRRWVKYEITKAWNDKRALVGIRITASQTAAATPTTPAATPSRRSSSTLADRWRTTCPSTPQSERRVPPFTQASRTTSGRGSPMPISQRDEAECPFCEIVTKDDRDVREVCRDDQVVVFFPLEPATLGHTLVIPRRHVPDIWAVDNELAAHLGQATVKVAHAVGRAMRPDGLNIIQSNGEAATQTVMHLHIHVVPRWHDDKVGRIWPPESSYSEDQKDEAWERIRAECRGLTD